MSMTVPVLRHGREIETVEIFRDGTWTYHLRP
jgi:hypothetical protein